MKRLVMVCSIIIGMALFIGGMRLKDQFAASRPNHTAMNLAVFSACNAVKKMAMIPGPESTQEADHAIARIEAVVQTHTDQEIADNTTYLLKTYQAAIEEFKKDPSEKTLAALNKIEHAVDDIRETVRPQ